MENIPTHVVILLDGNRRWAVERGLKPFEGHLAGFNRTKELLKKTKELGIKYVTLWSFSTENWKRPQEEVDFLMDDIFIKGAKTFFPDFLKEKVGFKHIGRKDRIPTELRDMLEDVEEKTKNYTDQVLILALDYGGRDEIVRAVKKIVKEGTKPEDISDEVISNALDTHGIPDPDLLIRTSGEHRLSGMLPWQSTYAELEFVKEYYPDFTPELFEEVIKKYSSRKRRFGK